VTVSMKDVAKAAGVSLSTVSRALADSPRVKPETREQIQRIAAEMGYLPSAIARGLATKRTHTLGIVVMDIADLFTAEIVRTIDKTALDHDYSVILSNCGADPQRGLTAIKVLHQHRVDGIIVTDPFVSDSFLPLLEESGMPVIIINKKQYPYSVGTDNVDAARQAIVHLLDLGHQRIAYIGSSRHREESLERQRGYEQALVARGISPDPSLVIEGDGWPEGGWLGMERLLKLPRPPGAVFCFNDMTAAGAIKAAHAAGWRVPHNLSIVGFDDINLALYLVPPLTTVAQQKDQIAQLAVEMALSLRDGNEPPANTILPGKLVVRGSTAPPGL
jgi:DNA-binding LacI/PurR family transcriptional regulator